MGKPGLLIVAALLVVLMGLAAWQSLDRDGAAGPRASSRTHALRQELKDFWAAYDSATQQRIEGEWRTAADLYERALEINPRHEESLYYLGNCHFELGDYVRAVEVYRRLLRINPDSNRGYAQLGLVLFSPWPGAPVDFEEAEAALLKSVELYPEESGGFVRLGRLALAQGRAEEALECFDQAAGFRSAEGIFWSGFVRFRQGRFSEAAARFQEVLEQQSREVRMSGTGIVSEGDQVAAQTNEAASADRRRPAPISPDRTESARPAGAGLPGYLQAAAARSRVYLYWSWRRLGGYPPDMPEAFKLHPDPLLGSPGRAVRVSQEIELGQARRGAWADYDGDGDADLAVAGSIQGLRLYRNHEGQFQSQPLPNLDIEEAWDLAWGDFDSDGRLDLYLVAGGYTGLGRNRLLRQTGRPNSPIFEDVTVRSGLGGERATVKAIFLDYNGDGRLDLLEAGHQQTGVPALRLFRNLPGNTFLECGRQARVALEGSVVDAATGDYNGDGRQDLLVLRWKQPPVLYRNEGNGMFADASASAGIPDGLGGQGFSGLFIDADRDGRQDLLITRYPEAVRPMEGFLGNRQVDHGSFRLLRNLDGENFEDVTAEAGLSLSFSVLQLAKFDLDKDGWDDLIVANGSLDNSRLEPSVILHNDGGRFSVWGYIPAFDEPISALGVAVDAGRGRNAIYLAGAGLFQLP
ncbi:MAG TPA: FG-GAP-like repeat-containing protein [Acidobacteriota bacterium]|nr:FG-GAP-like repeat-containing protein [Acidobacteriota bacterium]